jgi:hypothetical protein
VPALSDDSSAQGRGLLSATTVYLQAPPQTVLPKPEHRPNCRCPVNNYRVVVGKSLSWREWVGWAPIMEHRMLLSATLGFGPLITHTKTISSPSFLYSSQHTFNDLRFHRARNPTRREARRGPRRPEARGPRSEVRDRGVSARSKPKVCVTHEVSKQIQHKPVIFIVIQSS